MYVSNIRSTFIKRILFFTTGVKKVKRTVFTVFDVNIIFKMYLMNAFIKPLIFKNIFYETK